MSTNDFGWDENFLNGFNDLFKTDVVTKVF